MSEECCWKQWWVHEINPEACWPTSLDKGRGLHRSVAGVALRAPVRSGGQCEDHVLVIAEKEAAVDIRPGNVKNSSRTTL